MTVPPDPPPPEEIAAVLDWMLVACALFVDKLPLARALREVRAIDVAVASPPTVTKAAELALIVPYWATLALKLVWTWKLTALMRLLLP